ncbi:MAG: hypothetical protein K8R77_04720, partial [Anaerolineaceae bacterium]|nr:hypothetical protein [Anaerolineaceae bacterium]
MSNYQTESEFEFDASKKPERRRYVRVEKLPSAFWTVASVLSLLTNAILITITLSLSNQLFRINKVVQEQLVEPLDTSFTTMYEASIQTTVAINTTVPARFDLPLDIDTIVILSQDTFIPGARVTLNTGGLSIYNAPADVVLPAGTNLPVHLNLTVPVDQTIPVVMNVPVNIPLKDTALGDAFSGLINVVSPYEPLLQNAPASWTEMVCGKKNT